MKQLTFRRFRGMGGAKKKDRLKPDSEPKDFRKYGRVIPLSVNVPRDAGKK
jgi:hypothetical protein